MAGETIEDSLGKQAEERVDAVRRVFMPAVEKLEWSDEPAPVFQPEVPAPDGESTAR